jgi:hypothetical protein
MRFELQRSVLEKVLKRVEMPFVKLNGKVEIRGKSHGRKKLFRKTENDRG